MFTRRSLLRSLPAAALASRTLWATSPSCKLFIGTGTGKGSGSKGIYVANWRIGGMIGPAILAAELASPTFLAISKNSRHLYAISEVSNGTVFAFTIEHSTGHLKQINMQSTLGSGPAHVALSANNHAAFATNYGSGSLTSYSIDESGALSSPLSHFQYTAADERPEHAQPHAHEATSSRDSRWVLVNDLGSDRIYIYRADPQTGALTPGPQLFWQGRFNSGPRHLVFHPNGHWVYNANELDSTVNQLAWHGHHGTLTTMGDPISTLPPGLKNPSSPSEILISSDGRFLYVGNRGFETIAVSDINQRTGSLSLAQLAPHGGKTARHIALDPTENFLLTACQDSNGVVVFSRDKTTGKLSLPVQTFDIDSPQCIVFTSSFK